MAKEFVLVQRFTDVGQIRLRQELRRFNSREAAVRFVMEELESGRRHNARMIAEGTEFNIVDIVRMYAGRKARCGPRGLI